MILTDILVRVFFIRSEQYGTAFALDVNDHEYLVTARHLLPSSASHFEIQLFHDNKWLCFPTKVVGRGKGEIDIAVLKLPNRLIPSDYIVAPSSADLPLGHEMFFLGYPYKMWGDGGQIMGGKTLPFVKKGTLSYISVGSPQVIYVDAINNEGFSGGPLCFYAPSEPKRVRVAGVVSKYRIESESVVAEDGEVTKMTVPYNTGFLLAYGIKHVLELIRTEQA